MSKLIENSNVQTLKQLFLEVDTNHNGRLDKEEFKSALSKMALEEDEIQEIWMAVDSSGDGEVE